MLGLVAGGREEEASPDTARAIADAQVGWEDVRCGQPFYLQIISKYVIYYLRSLGDECNYEL